MTHAMSSTPLLDIKPSKLFRDFQATCAALSISDVAHLAELASLTMRHLHGSAVSRTTTEPGEVLLQRWYASLAHGEPDWSVYGTDYYLAECWACWAYYSRKYLRQLAPARFLPPHGIVVDIGEVPAVLDLGCGLGYTSAALRELFPHATVYATNLPETSQYAFAQALSQQAGFSLHATVQDAAQAGCHGGIVFASEYFEHIQAPVAHLREVLACVTPRALLIANTFNARAIGHFDLYAVDGVCLDGQATSRQFNATLREAGYVKRVTKLWNNRPAYWTRREE